MSKITLNLSDNSKTKIHNHFIDGKNTLSSSDIMKLCRACLGCEGNMISLLPFHNNEELANMFLITTSLKVEEEENLPLQVCHTCQREIINSFNFRLKCHDSDSYLRSFIGAKEKQDTSHSSREKDESLNTSTVVNIIDDIKHESENELKIEEQDIEYLEEEILRTDEIYNNSEIDSKRIEFKNNLESNKRYTNTINGKKNKKRKKKLECEVCFKTFLKIKTLNAHYEQNHSKNKQMKEDCPFPCDQCKEVFNCEHDLHVHSAVHECNNGTWTCNKCHKEFTVLNGLRRHIQRHMQHKRHVCACGKAFAERCALRRHARVHTGERPDKKFLCHICDSRFLDRSQLATHVARHTGERTHSCACGKAFRSRRLLVSHARVHSDTKPYVCLYCPKRFRHESTLNTHHRTHTGEKPYVCSVCGKSFIQHSNLTLHTRTHTGEKPYSCDFCGRKFSSGSSLSSHRRTHTGEKPYSCSICDKRFARKDAGAHMRLHTGERPHQCAACRKCFTTAARLRDHCLIHTGEKKFECALCTEKFKRRSYLARHLRWHEAETKMKNEARGNVIVWHGDPGKFNATVNKESERLEVSEEIPLEVSQELILDDRDVKNEVIVGDEGPHSVCQNDEICLDSQDVHYVPNTVSVAPCISHSTSVIDGTPIKLYQVENQVQIETVGQLIIRQVISKTTANF